LLTRSGSSARAECDRVCEPSAEELSPGDAQEPVTLLVDMGNMGSRQPIILCCRFLEATPMPRLSLGRIRRPAPRAGLVVNRTGRGTALEATGPTHAQSQGGAVQRPGSAVGRVAPPRRQSPGGPGAGLGRPDPTRGVPGDPGSDPPGGPPAPEHAAAGVPTVPRGGAVGSLPRGRVPGPGGWRRRVDRKGRISISGLGRSVGRAWAHQDVVLRFAASSRCCMVSDPDGELIKQIPASELTRERILALAVSRRRSR